MEHGGVARHGSVDLRGVKFSHFMDTSRNRNNSLMATGSDRIEMGFGSSQQVHMRSGAEIHKFQRLYIQKLRKNVQERKVFTNISIYNYL